MRISEIIRPHLSEDNLDLTRPVPGSPTGISYIPGGAAQPSFHAQPDPTDIGEIDPAMPTEEPVEQLAGDAVRRNDIYRLPIIEERRQRRRRSRKKWRGPGFVR